MKVNSLIYTNKILLRSLKFASGNSSLFSATASLALSTIARPISIMTTPCADRENKKLACAKSFASSAVGYLIMAGASLPVASAIKKIDQKPADYLKRSTIKALKGGAETLAKSGKYSFATQLFKLGLGLVIAAPKSVLTCALIPPIMAGVFKRKKDEDVAGTKNYKDIAFSGISAGSKAAAKDLKGMYDVFTEFLAQKAGKILDKKSVQNLAEKYSETNFAQHIMSATDVVSTLTFAHQTAKSKGIEQERKKTLINNSLISTGLCITGGYGLHQILKKPTEKYIENFKAANKNLPELERYVEGIKIAKPALILGGIYYIAIPAIATFFAERVNKNKN